MPRRARRTGNVFWGCSNYPKLRLHDEPRAARRPATTPTTARWRARATTAICLICGSTSATAPDAIVPGERYPGGPPNPDALARPARGRARGANQTPQRRRPRVARRAGRRPPAATKAACRPPEPPSRGRVGRTAVQPGVEANPSGRAGRRRVSAGSGRPDDRDRDRSSTRAIPPGPRRPRRVAAHPARLRRPRSGPTSLAGGARRRLAAPGANGPAGLPRRARRRPRPVVGRPAAGGHPLVPPLGGPERAGPGRSVGRDRDAAPAAPPAARPRGRRDRPAAGRHRRGPGGSAR